MSIFTGVFVLIAKYNSEKSFIRCFTRTMYNDSLAVWYTNGCCSAWCLVPVVALLIQAARHGNMGGVGASNYFTHRLHHECGLLYRTIHKVHHLFRNTIPIDS